jgi:RNase P subunit RPR2
MKEKICRQCQLSFPATLEYFYKAWERNGITYLRSTCKECHKDNAITYYDKNRGKILDKAKERYKKPLQNSIDGIN